MPHSGFQLIFLIGSGFFFVTVNTLSTALGLWASSELRKRLDLVSNLRDQLFRENDRLNAIYKITQILNADLDSERVLQEIVTYITSIKPIKGCVVRLLSDDRKTLLIMTSAGIAPQFVQKGSLELSKESIDLEAIKTH